MASDPSLPPSDPSVLTVQSLGDLPFRMLVANIQEYAIFLLDPNGYIVTWNAGAERIKGYAPAEILGQHFSRFYPPEDVVRGKPEQELATAIVEGRYEEESWRLRKDGSRFWANVVITPLRGVEGGVRGFIKVTRDTTEQKRVADTRQQTEEEKAQALEALRRSEEENARLLAEVKQAVAQQRTFLSDMLASVTEGKLRLCDTPADLPARLPPTGPSETLTPQSLRALRQHTMDVAIASNHPAERWQDLVTAVGEAAMNAVVHAGGGEALVCADSGGTVQVWIQDKGKGIAVERLHRATLERGYTTAGTLGHGFWMILKTADRIFLLTGPSGTTVVLEQGLRPPDPVWLREF